MADASTSPPPQQHTPPPNTEQHRRDLAWDLIEQSDAKFLHRLLVDLLCAQWKESDDDFQDWWQSVHENDGE